MPMLKYKEHWLHIPSSLLDIFMQTGRQRSVDFVDHSSSCLRRSGLRAENTMCPLAPASIRACPVAPVTKRTATTYLLFIYSDSTLRARVRDAVSSPTSPQPWLIPGVSLCLSNHPRSVSYDFTSSSSNAPCPRWTPRYAANE